MKKIITIAAAILSFNFAAIAQSANSSASQAVNLSLSNAIALTFTGSGTATGAAVNLDFNTVNDYANGVESNDQQMMVQSNKNFNVSVKTNGQNFTYTGSASPAPSVQIQNVLQMKVSANNTGGSLSNSNYSGIPSGSSTIINWGSPGGNKTFAVKYKAIPGFSLPGGTYTAEVVYTATQP